MEILLALKGELAHHSKPWWTLIGGNVHPAVIPSRNERRRVGDKTADRFPAIVYQQISDTGAGFGHSGPNDPIGIQRVQLSVYGKSLEDVARTADQLKRWANTRPNNWLLGGCCNDCPRCRIAMMEVVNVFQLPYNSTEHYHGAAVDIRIRAASGY